MCSKYLSISLGTALKYYKREDVQKAILKCAEDKEVAISYSGKGYGKRPDVLKYPRDVLEFVKKGATSFHCSEELWYNPLSVVTGMKPQELNELRKGWDLLLDIDCPELEYSKVAAQLLIQALHHYDVKHVSIKFSGNHGFHIGVPFEAFPETAAGNKVKDLFPEGPKRIAIFLQEKIRSFLAEHLLKLDSLDIIAKKIGKQTEDLVKDGKFDPFEVLDIDTVLIASRHLYRMPWSLNEKSGLVSVVITPDQILSFKKANAITAKVNPTMNFMDRSEVIPGEAKRLFVEAFDFNPEIEEPDLKDNKPKEFEPIGEAIAEEFFPPCIINIKKGLDDGKKRAVLVLINFLSSVGWSYSMMEEYLKTWNKNNPDPLREVYIQGQLKYYKLKKKAVLPPNCNNKAYMVDMGICKPDGLCKRIKNPVNYTIGRHKINEHLSKKQTKKKSVKTVQSSKPEPL
jgi:DNA primase large subunit